MSDTRDAGQTQGIVVLGCGGRYYFNQENVNTALGRIHRANTITGVIHGAATGADTLAGRWARDNMVAEHPFPAEWQTHEDDCKPYCYARGYCAKAGYRRNKQMLKEGVPDLVIAFPGGNGTKGMVKIAVEAGVPTVTVGHDGKIRWAKGSKRLVTAQPQKEGIGEA